MQGIKIYFSENFKFIKMRTFFNYVPCKMIELSLKLLSGKIIKYFKF